jgi:hypothetical protein
MHVYLYQEYKIIGVFIITSIYNKKVTHLIIEEATFRRPGNFQHVVIIVVKKW